MADTIRDTIRAMEKTTVYLPAELKRRLTGAAERRGLSEAELIRRGIEHVVEAERPPAPRLALFASGETRLAERVDAELARGFGRR